jgi:hypothetical protein
MTDTTDNARGPERIFAWEIDHDDMPPNGYYALQDVDDCVPYIRADLAPDPLADPRVKALVDAVSAVQNGQGMQFRTADYHGNDCKCLRCLDDAMFAALAALTTGDSNE